MIIEGNKIHLDPEEYRNLRHNIDGWEWNEYTKVLPIYRDLQTFMGAPLVACIEKVLVYVDVDDNIDVTMDRIRALISK